MVTKEHILAEIVRTAQQNGSRALGRSRFAAATGIREADWCGRYWTRWNDAIQEAGLLPNQLQPRFSDDAVLAKLASEVRRLGRLPTMAELRLRRREDHDFPSHGVFSKFGSKLDLADRLAKHCGDRADCDDVLGIVSRLAPRDREAPDGGLDSQADDGFGFVYLLKSRRFYKVGRTRVFERRARELAIQLPEPASRVHVIRTDDPVGIERYWHLRFADRRKNGEWFELTAGDVRAFKRRRFM